MVSPFLKWPGGKRWLTPFLNQLVGPTVTGRYYEPFLGGGACFFRIAPARSILNDLNPELVLTYQVVRDRPAELVRELRRMPVNEEAYYSVRESQPKSPLKVAARMLFLNRLAFNGIYRLNGKGQFNVPYGGGHRKLSRLWEDRLVADASARLHVADIRCGDFASLLSEAGGGDVVYCDPTYTVAHNNNGFIRYNERNFAWTDQQRLSETVRAAARRGAIVLVSNACHSSIGELYRGFKCVVVRRPSNVGAAAFARCFVQESLYIKGLPLSRLRKAVCTPEGKSVHAFIDG